MFNEAGVAGQHSDKPAVKRGQTIDRLRAALEKNSRIDLHRYPITLAYADNDLVLTGELEHIAAKRPLSNWPRRSRPGRLLSID